MRTVKLTIEVEVPDDEEWLTINKYGNPLIFTGVDPDNNSPINPGRWTRPNSGYTKDAFVKNWRDLKINLREYFKSKNSASASDSPSSEE